MAKSSVATISSPNSSPQLNSTLSSTAEHNYSEFDSSDDISLTSGVSQHERKCVHNLEEFKLGRKHTLYDATNLLHLGIYVTFFGVIFGGIYQFYQHAGTIGRSTVLFFIFGYVVYLVYITQFIYKGMSKICYDKLSTEKKIRYAPFRRLDMTHHTLFNTALGSFLMLSWKTPILLTILFSQIFFAVSLQELANRIGKDNKAIKFLLDIFEKQIRLTARLCLFLFGIYSITEYAHKDLGALPSDSPPRTIISNHISPLDIMTYFYLIFPSFVSKKNVKDLPLIGFMAEIVNSIFVERKDEHERLKAMADLKERQTSIYKGDAKSSLIVFPEGTTTNGLYLIPFKKGVFSCLLPIHTSVIIYESSLFSPAMDVIPLSTWLFTTILNFGTNHIKIYWLPELKPETKNAYENDETLIDEFAKNARESMSYVYLSKSKLFGKPPYDLDKLNGTYRSKLDAMKELFLEA